jgi:glycosyltransferase involved in cell wall biosynthesis
MSARMRILALEPYYGGSHRAVLDLLAASVDADWTLLTLPARKWKWRMRGAAITMAEETRRLAEKPGAGFDLVFASTFLNLAEFRGLAGPALASVPAAVYFHENQLVYPNRHTAEWDYQFPLTNITSALSADRCLFNTRWNLDGFLGSIPGFIGEFPDHHPKGLAEAIAAKSAVLAPPFDPAAFDAAPLVRGERCRIVWPHRWEHDKNPEEFFGAVAALAEEGLDFEVAVAGQSFAETSEAMRQAAATLGDRLVHCDEPPDREGYASLLRTCDVAVSTAVNEFFGLAMIESCYAGCSVVVPDRLAYTEVYPAEVRYSGVKQLVARLRALIVHRPPPGTMRQLAAGYTIGALASEYEKEFRRAATPR